MKKLPVVITIGLVLLIFIFSTCTERKPADAVGTKDSAQVAVLANGGFESQAKWGEHLVLIGGCNHCHTPKKMTPTGPEPDMSLALSGHPANAPAPDVDRKDIERKGLAVTAGLTTWVGPWGISYASNISSDGSGIGNWTEEQFLLCLREGKWKGIASNRMLLPPMPWQDFGRMSDGELKAIFAYLKSTKPISNTEPAAQPPLAPPPGKS